jgi:SagB-type dehydrogenase family enzyme
MTEEPDMRDLAPPDTELREFELYHERSKQRRHDLEFNRRIHLINSNADFHRVIARAFKGYPGASLMKLPTIQLADGPAFERVVALRRSIRRFTGEPLTIDELARLLYLGNGLTGSLDATEGEVKQPLRAAPSGGALFPVEIYAVVTAVEDVEPGVYHYAVDRHALELIRPGRFVDVLAQATSDGATFSQAAVTFVLTGIFGRSHFKYGERAYRFALLEAGHICQNVLLAATALNLGAVAVGGFVDEEINELLDLDGVDEAVIYLTAAGRPAPRPVADEIPLEAAVDQFLSSLQASNGGGLAKA